MTSVTGYDNGRLRITVLTSSKEYAPHPSRVPRAACGRFRSATTRSHTQLSAFLQALPDEVSRQVGTPRPVLGFELRYESAHRQLSARRRWGAGLFGALVGNVVSAVISPRSTRVPLSVRRQLRGAASAGPRVGVVQGMNNL